MYCPTRYQMIDKCQDKNPHVNVLSHNELFILKSSIFESLPENIIRTYSPQVHYVLCSYKNPVIFSISCTICSLNEKCRILDYWKLVHPQFWERGRSLGVRIVFVVWERKITLGFLIETHFWYLTPFAQMSEIRSQCQFCRYHFPPLFSEFGGFWGDPR